MADSYFNDIHVVKTRWYIHKFCNGYNDDLQHIVEMFGISHHIYLYNDHYTNLRMTYIN